MFPAGASASSNLNSLMARHSKIIAVFGSSHPRPGEPDYEGARLLGSEFAARGFSVCTGGYGGVMEAALRGAKESGGHTVAITATFFRRESNSWAAEQRVAKTWQERLFELIRISDGYVVCKGGTGTMAELAVVWEMMNKQVMSGKPLAVLGDFWAPVIERICEAEQAVDLRRGKAIGQLVRVVSTPAEAADFFARTLAGKETEKSGQDLTR